MKRELKRLSPDVKIDVEQIRGVLENEVLKREVVEGDKADEASKRMTKAASKALRIRSDKKPGDGITENSVENPQSEMSSAGPTTGASLPAS